MVIIRTVQPLSFFKENKGSVAKALRLELQVFAPAGTESVIEALNRKNYILLKIKFQNLNEILDVLRSITNTRGLLLSTIQLSSLSCSTT